MTMIMTIGIVTVIIMIGIIRLVTRMIFVMIFFFCS